MVMRQRTTNVGVERLEARRLLASYHVADYFPMPTGATWAYAGVEDGVAYTQTERYSRATFNGHAAICDTTTVVKAGGTMRQKTYVKMSSVGLQMYGAQFIRTDGTVVTYSYAQPRLILNPSASDGQIVRWPAIPVVISIRNPNGSTKTYQGSDSGVVTVNGTEAVSLSNDEGFTQALKLTMSHAFRYTVSAHGKAVTITDRVVDTGWQVKGLGSVRTETTDRVTYSNGLPAQISTASTTLTAASLLLNFVLSPAKVAENQSAGTLVGTFTPAYVNPGGDSTYQLVSTSDYPDNAAFAIVGNQLLTARRLNYEAKRSYTIRIKATDAQGTSYVKMVVVTVANLNEAPTRISISHGSVAESMPAGTVVGTLSAADPDANSRLHFALVDGEGSADNTAFTISAGRLTTARRFSYDAKSSYSIRVRVTDQGGLTYERPLLIQVSPALLVARLSNGTLSIHGSNAADRISVKAANGIIATTLNHHTTSWKAAQVQRVMVSAFAGNDSVDCRTLNLASTISGGGGRDTLFGSQAGDFIVGGTDNDLIYGRQGDDVLLADAGHDTVYGGSGSDTLHGGTGSSILYGDSDNDILYTRNGVVDTLNGGDGTNSAQIDSLLDKISLVQTVLA